MELSLIPLSYKSLMRMVKKVSIYTQFGAVALLLVLAVAGFFAMQRQQSYAHYHCLWSLYLC